MMPTNERIVLVVVGSVTCVHWLALLWDIRMTIWWPTMHCMPENGSLNINSLSIIEVMGITRLLFNVNVT